MTLQLTWTCCRGYTTGLAIHALVARTCTLTFNGYIMTRTCRKTISCCHIRVQSCLCQCIWLWHPVHSGGYQQLTYTACPTLHALVHRGYPAGYCATAFSIVLCLEIKVTLKTEVNNTSSVNNNIMYLHTRSWASNNITYHQIKTTIARMFRHSWHGIEIYRRIRVIWSLHNYWYTLTTQHSVKPQPQHY